MAGQGGGQGAHDKFIPFRVNRAGAVIGPRERLRKFVFLPNFANYVFSWRKFVEIKIPRFDEKQFANRRKNIQPAIYINCIKAM